MGAVIRVRPTEDEDLETLWAQQNDPEANTLARVPARDRSAFFDAWRTEILANDSVVKRTILAGDSIAGHCICFERDGRREVGYWLGRVFRGQGIAAQALAMLLPHVHERPLYGVVALTNKASIRVLEKCGFTPHETTETNEVLILDR
ncbi:MAG: GNAT family N-acetyltransferase [Nannocystaceae bacterium]